MKIVVPSAGPVPDRSTVSYLIKIAKKLNAKLVVLRILAENEPDKDFIDSSIKISPNRKMPSPASSFHRSKFIDMGHLQFR
ncbi:MAG: hypothetical protein WBG37_07550 [Desulfobacterales bacterium]